MQIYLARHGIAESGGGRTRDADRALTAAGMADLRLLFTAAKRWGVSPSMIVSSPYLRARQTAEIAASALGYSGSIEENAAFVPNTDTAAAWDEIRDYRDEGSLLIASHEPLVGLLIGYLTGAPSLGVEVERGALACIAVESFGPQPRGVLRWFVNPSIAG